ncbi:hypothetical protein HOD20_05440 [archaeon]|jgi:hypothetical protein|nr:hypothetical protein [archaeon]MBT4351947.1 hypothetical protein [archaeon]MBT4646676.1 hypothetical protein [archaeon]MBT6821874.1 hypothetical protein [archaeon]MBT7392284.1 hypothetical protein [archaeon]
MFKKRYQQTFLIGLLILLLSSTVFAMDVPFEVVKTKVVAETTVIAGGESMVKDGILVDFPEVPSKDGYDPRVRIPTEGVNYKLEFWNVGKMGGSKWSIFKSGYEKAKLTITYETGQAYKLQGTGEKFMDMESVESVDVRTPNFEDTLSYDIWFTGGPYGKFFHTDKNGKTIQIAYIENGEYIHFTNIPEKKHLLYYNNALIQIEDSSAFEKWLEILNQQPGCIDPSDPKTDSGWRFTDYEGEVMVRPCDDEDAWYGAELDMVLHRSDHIKNGEDSTCSIMSTDMFLFIMNKPESEIILTYSEQESNAHVIWGKIKVNVKRMLKDGTMDVEMSQAVAGIKGTIFVVEETGTESTLKVIEGEVEFTSKSNGKSEMVGAGEMITATKKGLEKKKKFDIAKENATWESNEAMIKDIKNKNNSKGSFFFLVIILFGVIGVGSFYFKKQKK